MYLSLVTHVQQYGVVGCCLTESLGWECSPFFGNSSELLQQPIVVLEQVCLCAEASGASTNGVKGERWWFPLVHVFVMV